MAGYLQGTVYPFGEAAVVIQFGEKIDENINRLVRSFGRYVEQCKIPGMIEQVPAFTTVTVFYDVQKSSYSEMERLLLYLLASFEPDATDEERIIEVPVCYGGEFGPDLSHVALCHGLTEDSVIRIHIEPLYTVYAVGFSPGFPYLGGLSDKITTPRRASPRLNISAGSVGIAGAQTGIYPLATPGGWQLIGRTPLNLFHPDENPPSLFQAGDRIKFVPISMDTWKELKGLQAR